MVLVGYGFVRPRVYPKIKQWIFSKAGLRGGTTKRLRCKPEKIQHQGYRVSISQMPVKLVKANQGFQKETGNGLINKMP